MFKWRLFIYFPTLALSFQTIFSNVLWIVSHRNLISDANILKMRLECIRLFDCPKCDRRVQVKKTLTIIEYLWSKMPFSLLPHHPCTQKQVQSVSGTSKNRVIGLIDSCVRVCFWRRYQVDVVKWLIVNNSIALVLDALPWDFLTSIELNLPSIYIHIFFFTKRYGIWFVDGKNGHPVHSTLLLSTEMTNNCIRRMTATATVHSVVLLS